MALLKEQNETISYAGDRSTGFAVLLPKLRAAKIRVRSAMAFGPHVGSSEDPAWLRLGFRHHSSRRRSMEIESDHPQLAEKAPDSGAGRETFARTVRSS